MPKKLSDGPENGVKCPKTDTVHHQISHFPVGRFLSCAQWVIWVEMPDQVGDDDRCQNELHPESRAELLYELQIWPFAFVAEVQVASVGCFPSQFYHFIVEI